MKREKIPFQTEDGDVLELFVEEETRIAGVSYLLATESEEEETIAYILKDLSEDGEETARYVMVEEEEELQAISRIFREMVEDTIEGT